MFLYEQNKASRELFYDGEIFSADAHGARVSREEQEILESLVSNYQQKNRHDNYDQVTAEVIRQEGRLNIGKLHFHDPLVEGYAQVAYQRAADLLEAWRGGPDYPVTGSDWRRFPGVDPAGKFCSKDMELEYRLNRLDIVKEIAEPQRKEVLSVALEKLRNPEGTIRELITDSRETFRNVREAQLAAMVCPDEATSHLLETKADQYLRSDPHVSALDRYVSVLEQVAGLHKAAPSQEMLATAALWNIDQKLLDAPSAWVCPQTVSVGLPKAEHVLQADRFASAEHWGRTPQELAVTQEQKQDFDGLYAQNIRTKAVEYLHFAWENAAALSIQVAQKEYQSLGGNIQAQEKSFDPKKLDPTKSLFEQYREYRDPLSKNERELLAAAKQQRHSGAIDSTSRVDEKTGKLVFEDPVLNGYLRIAEARAEKALKHIDTPIDADLYRKYPGVDPQGKYCTVDMQLEQRINRIRAAAAVATGVTADYVNDFLHAYDTDRGNVGYYKNQIQAESRKTRLYELGARVCPDPDVSRSMEDFAKQRRDEVQRQDLDRLLTIVEKVAGLNNEQLYAEDVAIYNRDIPRGYRLQTDTPVGNRSHVAAPDVLKIDLRDFKHVAWQYHNANPLNWADRSVLPVDDNPNNSRQTQSRFAVYGAAVAANALDGMFTSVENRYEGTAGIHDPDRGSLVIVGGKTIRERMQEHYNSLPDKSLEYNKWYQKNLPRLSGEILFAGLMKGEAVEAYVPNRDGKLPKEPTVITAQGYGPNRAKPVTMNAWERFFSKLGFYKEKAAQVKAQKAQLEARQRVRDTYEVSAIGQVRPGSKPINEVFFGQYLRRENIPDMHALSNRQGSGSGYRMSRSAASAACICMMAANGYNIRDILDPGKLLREKQQAGQIYMDHANMDPKTRQPAVDQANRTGDERWLGSVFFHGQMALRQQFNNLMKGKDLTDPQQYRELMPILAGLGDALYDACQEVQANDGVMEGHTLAAHQTVVQQSRLELSGHQLAYESAKLSEEMLNVSNDIGSFSRCLATANSNRVSLASPLMYPNAGLDVGNLITEQYLINKFQKEPDQPATQRISPYTETGNVLTRLQFHEKVLKISDSMKMRPTDWQENVKMIMSGELAKGFKVDAELYKSGFEYSRHVLQLGADNRPIIGPDGKAKVDVNGIVAKTTEVKSLQVTLSAELMKKFGIEHTRPAAQNRQPRTMR